MRKALIALSLSVVGSVYAGGQSSDIVCKRVVDSAKTIVANGSDKRVVVKKAVSVFCLPRNVYTRT